MKHFTVTLAVLCFVAIAGVSGVISLPSGGKAYAAESGSATSQNSVFAVKNMTCALCPLTVKTAMEAVEGVETVKIDFEAKTASVIFDPSKTTSEHIAEASTKAGYPASPLAEES
ncbi:heavy-metal-associated domain-containing protein [Minwuia sp.]|uniref:heavy-metal-associated domain-containing protein n=1 Tax=Minwuia sp. TaxID=2493630 RepID=UPI003A916C90